MELGPTGRAGVALTVRCQDMPKLNHHYQLSKGEQDLPDAALAVRLSGSHGWQRRRIERSYFIRPDVHFYVKENLRRAVERWPELPAASAHWFRLELGRRGERVEATIDGRYFSSFPAPADDEVRWSVEDGAEVRAVTTTASAETARFLPVGISRSASRGQLRLAELAMEPGLRDVAGIPMDVVPPEAAVDVGLSRWLRQETGASTFYDPYYRRSAWDGVPETIMFSVPRRFYNYAHVLCGVERSSGERPSMSVRVARYRQAWDGAGGTQADTTVVIDPAAPKGCTSLRKVGTGRMGEDNAARPVDLYLAQVPLRTGELADCLQAAEMTGNETPDHLTIELCRELRTRVMANYAYYERKPLGPPSSLHVLAVTLEKAPVEILIGSDVVGNVFHVNEEPRLRIAAHNPSVSTIHLRMTARLTDFQRREAGRDAGVALAPGRTTVPFDVGFLEPGWYEARFTFSMDGRQVWEQPLSLALLPPDTRTAGDESPFGTWWFARSHYCEPNADKVLPLVQRMGFRHVSPRKHDPRYGHTAETFAQYGVTPSMMARMKQRGNLPPVEEQAATFMKDWPGTRFAMVFHETGGLPFGLEPPPELLGKPPPEFSGEELAKEEELLERLRRHAAAIRSAAPEAKIVLGNSTTNFNVHWLRKGLSRELWDYVGAEMAVQLFHPESQPHGWNLQGLWIAKRMCEIYGYDDVPATTCYEFGYRPTAPGALPLREQANWYCRDVLHCLAYRLPNINVGLLFDVDSAYYFSRWGSTGVCSRSPLMMPKPSFVALATLTRVLDRARYRRYRDTGSHSLYCLEFEETGGFVYALWTTTGRRDTRLAVGPGSGTCTLTDTMGREEKRIPQEGALDVQVSESPLYVSTSVPLERVTAGQPHHDPPRPAAGQVVDRLHANDWEIVAGGDETFRDYCPYKPLTEAACAIAPGEGGTLRLTLQPQPDVPDIVGRYVVLAPKAGPIVLDKTADTLGAWVNGNSSWGRLVFQVEDAEGNLYTSVTLGDWDVSDWRGHTRISFDGWKFIGTPFPADYASGHYGLDTHRWSRSAEMKAPVEVTRLYVIMREKLVYVTDMVPARSMSIELRDLTAGPGPEAEATKVPVPRR